MKAFKFFCIFLFIWLPASAQEDDVKETLERLIMPPERSQNFICQGDIQLSCNHIPNPGFQIVNPLLLENAFAQGNVPDWGDSGSSDVNGSGLPPYQVALPTVLGGSNYASMLAWNALYPGGREGIGAKIMPVESGKSYGLSFFLASSGLTNFPPATYKFTVVLMNCQENLPFPITIPQQSQVVFCESFSGVLSSNWNQYFVKFTATGNYNMIMVFPDTDPTIQTGISYVHFAYPELMRVDNFTAGNVLTSSNCNVTVGPSPLNCSFKNAQYTWTAPGGGIVSQGTSQLLNLDMSTAPTGNYILSMSIPGTVQNPNNNCSQNNPILAASTNVPIPCTCGSLQITNPTMQYWNVTPTSSNLSYVQNLSSCYNNLCHGLTDDIPFVFSGSSNQSSGNIWEARIVTVSPFTYGGGSAGGTFNGNIIPYPYSGAYYTFSNASSASLTMDMFLVPGEVFILEIRLTNTILSQSRILQIKVVPPSWQYPAHYWCVQQSPGFPYPHKMMYAQDFIGNPLDVPGFTYQWTFPSGMTLLTGTNSLHVEWDDSGFDYVTTPNPVASLFVSNIYGCNSFTQYFNIAPQYCTPTRMSGNQMEAGLKTVAPQTLKDDLNRSSGSIFPNPTGDFFRINSKSLSKSVLVQTLDGKILLSRTNVKVNEEISVSKLNAGIYIVTVYTNDGSKNVFKLVKK